MKRRTRRDFFCNLSLVLITLTLLIWPGGARAEVTVQSEVDRTEMDPGDIFNLTIAITADEDLATIDDPQLPDLSNFFILKQWTSEGARSGIMMTPTGPEFKTTAFRNYNYTLQPKKEGRFTIGGVQISIDGNKYITKPQQIHVARGASQSQQNQGQGQQRRGSRGQPTLPPGLPPDIFDNEDDLFAQLLRRQGGLPPSGYRSQPNNQNELFFVQVEVDKMDVFQDEQVTASWYLYTRGQIRDLDTLKYPSLSGFWKEDIEISTQLNFQQEVINNVPYRKALLASFALFPIRAGTTTIDPYKVRCSVYDLTDPFGMFGNGQVRQYTKVSLPVKINVKALPEEGRPADFSGAVGSFQVSARVEEANVIVGEPFSLRLRFEGKGNAKRIDLPPLGLPESLELYETQKEAKFFRTGTSFRDFKVMLIPRQSGSITIPAISASFFDPAMGKYVTTATQPITVVATKREGVARQEASRPVVGSEKIDRPEDKEPVIAPNLETAAVFTIRQQSIGFGLVFIFLSAVLLWKARTELGWGQRKRDLQRRLHARFRKVNERMSVADWRGVGVEITNTVYFVIGEISGQGGANVEMEKLMMRAPPSVRRELAEPVMKLMESFQALSFAPDDVARNLRDAGQLKKLTSEMQQLMEKAVALGLSAEQDDESAEGPKAS